MPAGPILRGLGLAAVWLLVSVVVALGFFLHSDREVVVASHDSVISPTFGGWVVVRTGPVLPDVRVDSGETLGLPIGVDVKLGKTTATTTSELVERYALIASQPEGSIARVEAAVADMAYDAALRGGLVGLVPVAVWLLLGQSRRRELRAEMTSARGVAVATLAVLAVVLVWEPWSTDGETVQSEQSWLPLQAYLGDAVPVPEAAAGVQIRSDPTAIDSRRLVESAVSTFQQSTEFYAAAAEAAGVLDLRRPGDSETVAVLISDRHDNIGMDRVARAIGDRAGATAVLDAGDDTSTGQPWEAFSLDSVSEAFEGYDRFAVPGNHDAGDFVGDYLDGLGWTTLDGAVVDGPGGGRLIGVADPRSSGLGNWRDETGLSFAEVGERFSEAVCASDERVATVLVHDVNLARQALADGCADLVVGGHVHVEIGPTRVSGENGAVGYSYTTGTTGGAAYALAIGSKPRRDAMVTLITYGDDGRPAGLQPVTLQTNGSFVVGEYVELDLGR